MIDLTLYLFAIGAGTSLLVVYLYLKLSFSAKEMERKRLESEMRTRERLLKIKNLGWSKQENKGMSRKEHILIAASSLIVMVIIGIALGNIFVALGGGLIAYMLPKHIAKRNKKKEYKLKVKLLKPALQAVASAHTFQPNIVAAIQHAVGSMQQPLKKDFELFLVDVEMGVPLKEALSSLGKRVNIKYLDFFLKVVLMAEEEGGKTHELIKTCAEIIDQDTLVIEEFETEVSSQKREAVTLLGLQYVMLGFLAFTQPQAFAGFTTTMLGQGFVFYILLATFIAYQLIERFTDASMEEVQTGGV